MCAMTLDRLTGQDLTNIVVDEFGWPGHIGVIAMLDADRLLDPTGRVRLDEVRSAVAARLGLVPRLRQRVWSPPSWLGGPLWAMPRRLHPQRSRPPGCCCAT
jgi:hypothetical protein